MIRMGEEKDSRVFGRTPWLRLFLIAPFVLDILCELKPWNARS